MTRVVVAHSFLSWFVFAFRFSALCFLFLFFYFSLRKHFGSPKWFCLPCILFFLSDVYYFCQTNKNIAYTISLWISWLLHLYKCFFLSSRCRCVCIKKRGKKKNEKKITESKSKRRINQNAASGRSENWGEKWEWGRRWRCGKQWVGWGEVGSPSSCNSSDAMLPKPTAQWNKYVSYWAHIADGQYKMITKKGTSTH